MSHPGPQSNLGLTSLASFWEQHNARLCQPLDDLHVPLSEAWSNTLLANSFSRTRRLTLQLFPKNMELIRYFLTTEEIATALNGWSKIGPVPPPIGVYISEDYGFSKAMVQQKLEPLLTSVLDSWKMNGITWQLRQTRMDDVWLSYEFSVM